MHLIDFGLCRSSRSLSETSETKHIGSADTSLENELYNYLDPKIEGSENRAKIGVAISDTSASRTASMEASPTASMGASPTASMEASPQGNSQGGLQRVRGTLAFASASVLRGNECTFDHQSSVGRP